ncbi:hypothetical protein [Aeromonas enteropelogenes]|uniref:hypothetical protein n=1 Tax=Aeromonas enteropelogenes TaxID=29489 RepID=UPI003BA169C2
MSLDEAKNRIDLLKHFDYSLRLFDSNYQELISVIDFLCNEKVGLELFAVVNRWKLEEVLTHLGFKLHNYVCAAKSLIDHSRVLYRRVYKENEHMFDDYEVEVKARFDENTLSKFIEFLRTYCQHEKLPSIGTVMRFDSQSNEGFIFSVTIDSTELLKSSSIKSMAKRFIRAQGDGIDLRKIIDDYHTQVREFYQWVRERQQEIHSKDISLVNIKYRGGRINAIHKFIEFYSMHECSGTIREQLCTVLAKDNYRELEQYRDDDITWLESAINIIENDVELPEAIKVSLRSKVCA